MVYVAFVIDVSARKVVGWRVSTSMTTGFVLAAFNRKFAKDVQKTAVDWLTTRTAGRNICP